MFKTYLINPLNLARASGFDMTGGGTGYIIKLKSKQTIPPVISEAIELTRTTTMVESITAFYTIRWSSRLSTVDKTAWNALAVPLSTPFLEWEWLNLLETSGSITAETGWQPCHLTVWRDRELVGAAPLYVKSHSEGEFVFDHVWADVAEQINVPYYPKLVGMSPVTPLTGYQFLIAPAEEEAKLTALMIREIDRFCSRNGLSGCNLLFVDPEWGMDMAHHGFTQWTHERFVWENPGHRSFEEYLSMFKANQRRNIRRERKKMKGQGVVMAALTGEGIPADLFPLMYRLYVQTNEKFGPWGCQYLTRNFFDGLYEAFGHRLLLTTACKGPLTKVPTGMSLLVTKGDRLYGRYWGSSEEIESLHFNACYYEPIKWAIENGILRFDPGLGGPHKLRRGFFLKPSVSLHRIYHPGLRMVVQHHLKGVNDLTLKQIDHLNSRIPLARRAGSINS